MLRKVPEVTVHFWIVKVLTTGMGEATSDYLVHTIDPYVAVGIGAAVRDCPSLTTRPAALRRLGLLAGGRDGGGLRHDGRGLSPCSTRYP